MESVSANYLASQSCKKLHLGCGGNFLTGWLNTDYAPLNSDVIFLDATKPFDLPDASFDFVYSEHMIEHIDYRAGIHMLRESARVLKPGGRIRITTPNLETLIEIYKNPDVPLHREYIKWAMASCLPDMPSHAPAFVFNNFVRAWGHVFIYDPETLRLALTLARFTAIEERRISESGFQELTGLEIVQRMPPGFLQLESMTFEAVRL